MKGIALVISLASYTGWFPCETNKTALLMTHYYDIFLTKWPTDNRRCSKIYCLVI